MADGPNRRFAAAAVTARDRGLAALRTTRPAAGAWEPIMLSGPPKLTQPVFNFQALTPIYTTGARLGSNQHAEVLRTGVLKDVLKQGGIVPPWKIATPDSDEDVLTSLFTAQPLIDTRDKLFKREDLSDDFKNLFALYKGLNRLSELVEFAKTDRRADYMRDQLQRQFDAKLGEIYAFIDDTEFNDITLLRGLKTDKLSSTAERPDSSGDQYSAYGFVLLESQTEFYGNRATTVRSDPIPGLTGTETFTITITENGATTDILIDLANVTGGLTIDNIVDYINTQLAADGNIATYFEVERFNEDSYGIQINLSSGEAISFSAGTASEEPAVYVAGTFGTGSLSGGFLTKLDDLAAASPNEAFRVDINTDKADGAEGVAVDSLGNVYVVGTTNGDLDNQLNSGTDDLYLSKYDAAGNLVWSRLLGASDTTSGFAVAVDSGDNVVVVGQTSVPLTDTAYGGGSDTFVTKFTSEGQEQWTRQAAPFAADGGLGVTFDSSDNVFVTGYALGAVASDQTYGGGSDAFVTKLDSSGTLQYNKQFGGTGNETATAITVDNAGNLYVAYEGSGNGYVRQYADSATNDPPLYEVDLGSLGTDGKVTGLAIDASGNLFVSGYTTNTSLNGGTGGIVTAHAGGTDGFVTRINGTAGTIDWVTYVGSSGEDKAFDVVVNGSDVYVSGSTDGQLSGATKVGDRDAFVAKLDNAGALQWAHQIGGAFVTDGKGIAFDSTGTSVVTKLGLPNGPAPGPSAGTVISQTAARPGQQFSLIIDDDTIKTITLEDDDSFFWLAFKIQKALGTSGTATIEQNGDTEFLQITALDGAKIEVVAGPENFDALPGLGLREVTLYGEIGDDADEDETKSIFELGFIDDMSVLDSTKASSAADIVANAQRTIRKAYDFIVYGPDYDPLGDLVGAPSERMSERIAELESALAYVQSLNLSTNQYSLLL